MKIILLFVVNLLFISCTTKSNDKVYLPEMKFKHTKNPNYYHYFPKSDTSTNTIQTNTNLNQFTEPTPSFKSKPISNIEQKNKKKGWFSKILGSPKSKKQKSDAQICSDILQINRTVIIEQTDELKLLKDDKTKLIDDINNIEKKYQREQRQYKKESRALQSEITRLNNLIKILSTEIK